MPNVNELDIKQAYQDAARLVEKYGEKYLPIFQRLENEYTKVKVDSSALQRAIQIANSIEGA